MMRRGFLSLGFLGAEDLFDISGVDLRNGTRSPRGNEAAAQLAFNILSLPFFLHPLLDKRLGDLRERASALALLGKTSALDLGRRVDATANEIEPLASFVA